jgi:hypothetical protein
MRETNAPVLRSPKREASFSEHQVSNVRANWLMKKNEDLGEAEEVMLAGLD